MFLKRFSMLLGASTLFLLSSSGAFATVLAPGGSLAVYDDFGAIAYGGGATKADTGATAFTGKDLSGNTVFTGTLRQIVVLDAGFLDFIYQFTYASGDAIAQLSTTNFGVPFTTNVGICSACVDLLAGGSEVVPATIERSSGSGNVVRFNYAGGVSTRSQVLVIKTNATTFTGGNTALIDGGTANVFTYAPAPEPGTFGLLSGVLGLGLYLARRRRVA